MLAEHYALRGLLRSLLRALLSALLSTLLSILLSTMFSIFLSTSSIALEQSEDLMIVVMLCFHELYKTLNIYLLRRC